MKLNVDERFYLTIALSAVVIGCFASVLIAVIGSCESSPAPIYPGGNVYIYDNSFLNGCISANGMIVCSDAGVHR